MPTETTTDAVLNGIITCSQCNAGMALKQDETTGHLYFTCSQQPNADSPTDAEMAHNIHEGSELSFALDSLPDRPFYPPATFPPSTLCCLAHLTPVPVLVRVLL